MKGCALYFDRVQVRSPFLSAALLQYRNTSRQRHCERAKGWKEVRKKTIKKETNSYITPFQPLCCVILLSAFISLCQMTQQSNSIHNVGNSSCSASKLYQEHNINTHNTQYKKKHIYIVSHRYLLCNVISTHFPQVINKVTVGL